MPRFTYQADDADGAPVTGTLEAESLAGAAAQLESLGLTPRSLLLAIEEEPAQVTPAAPAAPPESIQRLLAVRERLAPALAAYAAELPPGPRRRRLRGQSQTLLADDETIQTAVAEAPRAWLPLVAAASSESPKGALAHFLQHRRRERASRQRLSFAAVYPLFLFGLALVVAWFLASTIVPEFDEIYSEFGLALPWPTAVLLAAGAFLRGGGAAGVLGLAILVAIGWVFWPRWAPARLEAFLRSLIGMLGMRPRLAANLTRRAADGIEAGLSVEEALRAADAPQDVSLRPALAMALGEEIPAAARVRLLRELDHCYLDHSAKRASWRHAKAGPLAITAIGLVVGFVVISLYLPLVNLITWLT